MADHGAKGVITVFFSLLSIIFIGLFFMLIESARFQGARADSVNITEIANFSVFGEYEKKLLKDYCVFAVDGSYGSGDFSIDRVSDRLKSFLVRNSQPASQGLSMFCFDPWQISLSGCELNEYALLTDNGCQSFYQQAVSFMRETAITNIAGKLIDFYRQAVSEQEKQETFEMEKLNADREMEEIEAREEAKRKELKEQAESEVAAYGYTTVKQPESKVPNPVKAIKKLMRKDLLTIVCGAGEISDRSISRSDQVSGRSLKKGNLSLDAKHGGLLNDLIFKEYLLEHFHDHSSPSDDGKLMYEIEYILCGKRTDKANLKGTVRRLLLLREGSNYVHCIADAEMGAQAEGLAALIIGWTGIPALIAILKHVLLIGWAYGESLLDVRALMTGGRVPLIKSPEDWVLRLENLHKINELLDQRDGQGTHGLDYTQYLRLLLYLQGVKAQIMRGMDLVEMNLRNDPSLSNFRADNCVVAIRDKVNWSISPVFGRVTGAFLGIGSGSVENGVYGGYAYEM